MERKYQLSVTSDTTDINVLSVNADEVARIVQLAGIIEPRAPDDTLAITPADPIVPAQEPAQPAASRDDDFDTGMATMRKNAGLPAAVQPTGPDTSPDDGGIPPDVDSGIPPDVDGGIDTSMQDEMDEMMSLDEDVAEYDYGHRKFHDEGEEVDEPEYIWQAVENPQRIKGSAGDNGLIQELHSQLVSGYAKYLAETERENDTGVMSPLSDPTKPSFDKDPLSDEDPVDDGSHSPMSTIVRQHAFK
jgi:hypothetical protein